MNAFSKNNHLKYGFTEDFLPEAMNSIFHIGLGDLSTPVQSFSAECIRAALDIQIMARGKNIYITLSGGVDSECVLRSFIMAKVPIKVAILKFKDDLNWHDVDPAITICNQLKVNYTLIEIDIFEFLAKEIHLRYAADYKLSSPMIASHLWLAEYIIENLQGFPIFSGDFARIRRPTNTQLRLPKAESVQLGEYVICPEEWYFASLANQDHFALDRLFHQKKVFGVANFYLYSPEQVASSIQNGFSVAFRDFENSLGPFLINKKKNSNLTFYEGQIFLNKVKEHLFRLGGFEVNTRDSKWTGFELVHEYFGTGQKMNGRALSPIGKSEEKISGMVLFNAKYRQPMEKIAQQTHLKRILLKSSLYEYIELTLRPQS